MNPDKVFVVGDKVEIVTERFSGVVARVVSATPTSFGRMYAVIIIDGKGKITNGVREVFGPNALQHFPAAPAVAKDNVRAPLEGTIIKPSQVKNGDEIEVTYTALDISRTNKGVVKNITTDWGKVYVISTGSGGDLYRDTYIDPEIKLIKAAEDPLTAKLRNSPIRTVFLAGDNSHGIKISSDRWKVDNGADRRSLTTHDLRLSLKDKTVTFLKEEVKILG